MRKSTKIILILSSLVVIPSLLFGTYKLMNSINYQVAGELIQKVDTDEKVVYLTFDDGPTDQTSKILEILDELDVKATFFLIGSNIEEIQMKQSQY